MFKKLNTLQDIDYGEPNGGYTVISQKNTESKKQDNLFIKIFSFLFRK